jgi:tRNA pseudouridine38-40 synthase
MKIRYFVELAFNGKNYNGWQIQENAPSVQEVINRGLGLILNEPINVVGCGRTDTGVHAKQFFAHFDTENIINPASLTSKLNGFFPGDLVIHRIFPVKPDAHARFDAYNRTYCYYITRKKDPFLQDVAYHYHADLDIDLMNTGSSFLMNVTDFTSFSKVRTQVKNNNCRVMEAIWKSDHHMIVFSITADRFLRNMVRAIVGTMILLGRHKITMANLVQIIESKNRSNAGDSVPAHGLFLEHVNYPDHIFSV